MGVTIHYRLGQHIKHVPATLNRVQEQAATMQNDDEKMMFCSAACKTQYGESGIEHGWVAELIRTAASFFRLADVYDEGDYYFTRDLRDAADAIGLNGQVIDSLGKILVGSFGAENVVKGGSTKIKGSKKYCTNCGNVEPQEGIVCESCSASLVYRV